MQFSNVITQEQYYKHNDILFLLFYLQPAELFENILKKQAVWLL